MCKAHDWAPQPSWQMAVQHLLMGLQVLFPVTIA
jgi:hypothetical protein